jgi:DNA-binding transcriptional regulator GbsR (MarR family)
MEVQSNGVRAGADCFPGVIRAGHTANFYSNRVVQKGASQFTCSYSGSFLPYFQVRLKGIKWMKTPAPAKAKSVRQPSRALEEVEQAFVDLWRNMSSLWGISPTMAQIHGLLFITGSELSMDDIMARLGISRGNVSMNLSKLIEWGLVRRIHKRGDRREYYDSIKDIWELFTLVASQRKRREMDPMLNALRDCRDRLSLDSLPHNPQVEDLRHRVNELLAFLTLVDGLAQRFFESHRSLRVAVELLAMKGK